MKRFLLIIMLEFTGATHSFSACDKISFQLIDSKHDKFMIYVEGSGDVRIDNNSKERTFTIPKSEAHRVIESAKEHVLEVFPLAIENSIGDDQARTKRLKYKYAVTVYDDSDSINVMFNRDSETIRDLLSTLESSVGPEFKSRFWEGYK